MNKRVCIFGDSISMGAFDDKEGGLANRLKLFVWEKNHDTLFYDLSVFGNTTSDLLKRFRNESEARKPDTIIFAIGMNDAKYIKTKDHPRVSFEQFKKNLGTLYKQASIFSTSIIFIGITRVDESKTKFRVQEVYCDNENIKMYDAEIQSLCKEKNLLYISMDGVLGKEDLSDGLHPNARGYEKMFQKIKMVLLEEGKIEKG